MNRWEAEVQKSLLASEEAAIKELETQYRKALKDINDKVKLFDSDIKQLQEAINADGLDETAKAVLISQQRSKVYQKQYQEALKGQVSGILDNLHGAEYATIEKYLKESYTDAYVGTMYDIAKQGVPVIMPIDQAAVVKAVLTDSKVSKGLYNALGVNVKKLKKTITQEVSRGIATGLAYADIARNISNAAKAPLSRAKTIARTEGHRIQVTSTADAQTAAKAKGADVVKQWDATLDGKTRDSHRRVDGEIRELDEKFSNGLRQPGDSAGGAAEVVNCRCALLTRARWALDEDELKTLEERAEFFGLDKAETFDDFKEKYLKGENQIIKAEAAEHPAVNKFGQTIVFDEKMLTDERWAQSVEVIKTLADEYDTRLTAVKVGAEKAAGTVNMGGLMHLSSKSEAVAVHEFAHSLTLEALTKYGVEDYAAFWKEIKSVRRAYKKEVGTDSTRWISTYEHSHKNIDEFLAEGFAMAKMRDMGIEIPSFYGSDFTYSNKVLEIIDKYFKKK